VSWFLQKSNGVEYGPTDLETLRAWAADGRIAADDLISRDRATWTPASKEVLLEIEWVVTTDQGDAGGPCHLRLFSEWLREGVLSPDTVVRNVRNGRRVVLGELFPDLVATLTAASAGPSSVSVPAAASETGTEGWAASVAAAEPSADGIAGPPERIIWQALARERDALLDEARKWHERHDREWEAARKREEELTARLRQTEQELIRLQSALEGAQQEIQGYRREREEVAEQGPSRDWAAAYFALARTHDTLTAELEQKMRELQTLREEVVAVNAAAEERARLADAQVATERRAADEARRALAESEQAHEAVLRSLRELNDRYIRLRERYAAVIAPGNSPAPAPSPPGTASPGADAAPAPGPRIRLLR